MSSLLSALDQALMEKYLHSQGALYYHRGCLDEAISCFEKAIRVADKAYTRFHLALALEKKGDIVRATAEMSRAIELNPAVPDYYHQRSLLWRAGGDDGRSEEDMARAAMLDPNFMRIDTIKSAITAVRRAFECPGNSALPDTQGIANGELRSIVGAIEETRKSGRHVVEEASCTLPCPAYCCHFSEAPLVHGVYIGPWKLLAIRTFLREKAFSEKTFLDRVPFKKDDHFTKLLPPHIVVRENGRDFVYAPKRRKAALGKGLLKYLPKGRDYQSLLWINQKARPCAFLRSGRCLIHDLAGEPGLPSCKEFLCLTGFAMVVLKHLGMVEQSEIGTKSLDDLNRISVEALVILYDRLYGNETLTDLTKAMEDALEKAIESDRRGESGKTMSTLSVYRHAHSTYDRRFRLQKEAAEREIRNLFRTLTVDSPPPKP